MPSPPDTVSARPTWRRVAALSTKCVLLAAGIALLIVPTMFLTNMRHGAEVLRPTAFAREGDAVVGRRVSPDNVQNGDLIFLGGAVGEVTTKTDDTHIMVSPGPKAPSGAATLTHDTLRVTTRIEGAGTLIDALGNPAITIGFIALCGVALHRVWRWRAWS